MRPVSIYTVCVCVCVGGSFGKVGEYGGGWFTGDSHRRVHNW